MIRIPYIFTTFAVVIQNYLDMYNKGARKKEGQKLYLVQRQLPQPGCTAFCIPNAINSLFIKCIGESSLNNHFSTCPHDPLIVKKV